MIKTYKATSVLSFSTSLEGGGHVHVKFIPYSYGGSIYTTSNEAIQKALENEPSYGSAYKLITPDVPEPEVEEEQKAELKKVAVNDIEEAKDYLSDNFGIKRTSMRRVDTIKNIAIKNGIEFVGI